MNGNLYIKGEIGVDVHLADVISQVAKQPESTMFNVYINSVGGSVDVGFDIYNYIKSLNVPINTIGQELVASIATVIFMAGNSRKLDVNCEFMIHLPSGSVSGTAEEIEAYNEMLKKYEKKLVDFYKEVTGLNDEAIKPLLRYETWLSPTLAFDFKFTTEKANDLPILAKATYNFKNENMNQLSKEDKSWIETQLGSISSLFKKSTIKNIVLQDANGVEIDFTEVAEGDQPIVGESVATVDGMPAEGDYLMPDGQTFVFVGGVLTEVIPVEADANAERISQLEQELADAKAEATAKANELIEATEVNEKFEKEFKALKSTITSKMGAKVEATKAPTKEKENESPYAKMLENIKNKKRK